MQDRFEFSIMGLLEILARNLKISYFIVTFKSIVKGLSDNETIIFFLIILYSSTCNICPIFVGMLIAVRRFEVQEKKFWLNSCSSVWKWLTFWAIFRISTGKISYTNSDGLGTWNPRFGFWNCHGEMVFNHIELRLFFIFCLKLVNRHDTGRLRQKALLHFCNNYCYMSSSSVTFGLAMSLILTTWLVEWVS